jgi:hypothetical protein
VVGIKKTCNRKRGIEGNCPFGDGVAGVVNPVWAQQRCHEFENGSKKDRNCNCFALVELRKERRRGFPLIRAQFVRKAIKTEGFFSGSL